MQSEGTVLPIGGREGKQLLYVPCPTLEPLTASLLPHLEEAASLALYMVSGAENFQPLPEESGQEGQQVCWALVFWKAGRVKEKVL